MSYCNCAGGPGGPGEKGVRAASAELSSGDLLGAFKARMGIGRMKYTVEPGLYAVGSPDNASPVLVSANYKLTFDTLRKNLSGMDCWLLILDTKGINVWCAAGKGTFGTDELVRRIEASGLSGFVSHRKLVLPQLGATGVSAHEVKRRSGFTVNYGPIRASDIKEYVDAGYVATREMRTVRFDLRDRLVLIPMELLPALKYSLPVFGVMLLINRFSAKPFDKTDYLANAGAVAAGTVLTPALLPYVPGRAFSLKGWLLGLGCTAAALDLTGKLGKGCGKRSVKERGQGRGKGDRLLTAGRLLLFPAISSFLAMNFTGSSTYTSPSGVNKEMRKALPFIVGAAAAGAALTLGVHLFGGRKR